MNTYKQLTLDDRENFFLLKGQGLSLRQIALKLGKSHSTLSRELKRNTHDPTLKWYQPYTAHDLALKRKSRPSNYKLIQNLPLRHYVFRYLKEGWSPELISGRIKIDHTNLSISDESIYRFIYSKDHSLIPYLARRRSKRRKKHFPRSPHPLPIPNRVSIDQRPELINQRMEFGHWESDSMVSRQNSVSFHVLVERKSRFVKISKVLANNSSQISSAIISRLQDHPSFARRSITYDNGSENFLHSRVNHFLGSQSFFCYPYHSWQKGSVENIIGLIRRFIPKKSDLQKVAFSDVSAIEYLLNTRPRKCLNFKTPKEVFYHSLAGALEM